MHVCREGRRAAAADAAGRKGMKAGDVVLSLSLLSFSGLVSYLLFIEIGNKMVACARAKHSARRPLEGEGHRALQAPAKRWTEAGEALSPSSSFSSSSPVLAPRESVALSGPNSVAHSAASRSLARSAIVGMRKKGVWGHLRVVKIIPHRSSQIAGPGRWPCPGPPCSSPPSLASFVHSFKTATATTVSIKVSLAGYSKSRKFT